MSKSCPLSKQRVRIYLSWSMQMCINKRPWRNSQKNRKGRGSSFQTDKSCLLFQCQFSSVAEKRSKEAFIINRPKSMRHRSQAFASNFQDTSVKRAMPNNDGWRHMNTQVQAMTSISSWNNWVIASHCNPEHMYYNLMKIMNLVVG